MTHRLSLLALTFAVALGGCRGMKSEKPPIHPNLNMDFVQRFEAQEANPLFEDGAAMRTPVAGTVARGQLKTTDNAPFEYGRTADGAYVADIPVPVTADLLERGQERYNIYCTVCHGYAGDGRGIVPGVAPHAFRWWFGAGAVAANRAMTRRVTSGANSASPAAATRTADWSSSGAAFLSRKPLAPASRASKR